MTWIDKKVWFAKDLPKYRLRNISPSLKTLQKWMSALIHPFDCTKSHLKGLSWRHQNEIWILSTRKSSPIIISGYESNTEERWWTLTFPSVSPPSLPVYLFTNFPTEWPCLGHSTYWSVRLLYRIPIPGHSATGGSKLHCYNFEYLSFSTLYKLAPGLDKSGRMGSEWEIYC